ncbi:hypothetical protein [Mycoplasma procyoni]|uniref:hypothetical protein n=1 Tax=Mycoplasma procyoni TaxID=568784 RepID=UPI00197BDCFA|nr:hypothetical protein [Mycoplasma procyoni]MBN3534406.1 hypothetical protein [Mycoplasma procyoni]
MDTSKLKKLSEQDCNEIGGAGFAAIVPFIPLIVSSIASLVGSFKSLVSSSGEIKTKEGLTQKWDNPSNAPKEAKSSVTPIYFIY